MKLLQLNCNSYCGDTPMENMAYLIQTIAESDFDVIALQEVNQEMENPQVPISELDNYIPCQDRVPIKEGNYVFEIVKALNQSGQTWYWTWDPCHVGWSHFDEGLALMSKHPIKKTNSFYLSKSRDYWDIKTRLALGIQCDFNGKNEWFYSCHFDKWHTAGEPFDKQWDRFCEVALNTAAPVYVMGDFNNDSSVRGEAYDYILETTNLVDTFTEAEYKDNGVTVGDYIAGWVDKDHPKEMRIDFIFSNTDLPVKSSQIIFNGKNHRTVSDHFGIEVEFGHKQKTYRNDPAAKIPEFVSQAVVPTPPTLLKQGGTLMIYNPIYRKRMSDGLIWQSMLELLKDTLDFFDSLE